MTDVQLPCGLCRGTAALPDRAVTNDAERRWLNGDHPRTHEQRRAAAPPGTCQLRAHNQEPTTACAAHHLMHTRRRAAPDETAADARAATDRALRTLLDASTTLGAALDMFDALNEQPWNTRAETVHAANQ